jgi:hypothetical protein
MRANQSAKTYLMPAPPTYQVFVRRPTAVLLLEGAADVQRPTAVLLFEGAADVSPGAALCHLPALRLWRCAMEALGVARGHELVQPLLPGDPVRRGWGWLLPVRPPRVGPASAFEHGSRAGYVLRR